MMANLFPMSTPPADPVSPTTDVIIDQDVAEGTAVVTAHGGTLSMDVVQAIIPSTSAEVSSVRRSGGAKPSCPGPYPARNEPLALDLP